MLKPKTLMISLLLAALAAASAFAQQPVSGAGTSPKLKAKDSPRTPATISLSLKSELMGREMPYRIILPANYKEAKDTRFPVIYLLHGLTGHFSNWTDKTSVAEYDASHGFIIVTPEGDNGWYSDSLTNPKDKYESYIVNELIPVIDKQYRTIADRQHRMIAGLSMGGYGSLKFGLKYPQMFSLVGSFSGALGATSWSLKVVPGVIGKSLDDVFGPMDSETRRANDIFAIAKGLPADKVASLPFMYLSCGTEDMLLSNNHDFRAILVDKKIPHEFREHPGGHEWKFWDDQVREFLAVASRMLNK